VVDQGEFLGAGQAFDFAFAFPSRSVVGMTLAVDQCYRMSCPGVFAADAVVVFRKTSLRIKGYSRVGRIIAASEDVNVPGLVARQSRAWRKADGLSIEGIARKKWISRARVTKSSTR
jgi:hypothetical protein